MFAKCTEGEKNIVLAAALVTTYVILSKANEATEQKLADLSAKVDAQKYVTAAEVEALIAAALAE